MELFRDFEDEDKSTEERLPGINRSYMVLLIRKCEPGLPTYPRIFCNILLNFTDQLADLGPESKTSWVHLFLSDN